MPLIADSFSSPVRPALAGERGAVSAAHPLAAAAGQAMLQAGGSAVDAGIAAQAVLCVVAPDACGLGGDLFALVGDDGGIVAVNGAGKAPQGLVEASDDGPHSITVPGLPGAWATLHARWGRLPLGEVLAPAIRLAEHGHRVAPVLAKAVAAQRARLIRHGAAEWGLLRCEAGDRFVQPRLAALLRAFADWGPGIFYRGEAAGFIADAVGRLGGALARADLAAHETETAPPLIVEQGGLSVAMSPPPTQGVLLGMALQGLAALSPADAAHAEHLCIELTGSAFAHRDRVGEGRALLAEPLSIDPTRASRRIGPRAYLHTAGVSAADADGLVLSSLVSVFDDFGSCVFVPELGLTLNNRAGGFTAGPNAAAPGKRPVHTLAPIMIRAGDALIGLATPGADGQVQTLLQLIDRIGRRGEDLAAAIAAPRWRSENGTLLVEAGHPAGAALAAFGHDVRSTPAGDMRFGAVACAGLFAGVPHAIADWRRMSWAGVA